MHFYVFSHWINRIPVYARTCGTADSAQAWVNDYRKRGKDGPFYTTDKLPARYWY